MNDSRLFSLQPESPENRQSVGVEYVMEVEVKNVRSTTVNNAVVDIYYPHRSDETGDYFYLLPNCMLDGMPGAQVLIQQVLSFINLSYLLPPFLFHSPLLPLHFSPSSLTLTCAGAY